MKLLTKLQYQVIYLYSKALQFNEIDLILNCSSKGIYSQVVKKDKSRVTRAKISRDKNSKNYKEDYKKYYEENKSFIKLSKQSIEEIKKKYREFYLKRCLNLSHQSYTKYKITFYKNIHKEVA